jgi:hypothetical protein
VEWGDQACSAPQVEWGVQISLSGIRLNLQNKIILVTAKPKLMTTITINKNQTITSVLPNVHLEQNFDHHILPILKTS